MLATREIPRTDWAEFFDRFSQVHAGWLVDVEIEGGEALPQAGDGGPSPTFEARSVRLEGVVADIHAHQDAISLLLGETPTSLAHHISHPLHVVLEQAEDGADVQVSIASADGTRTRLAFRSPLLPQYVDGTPGPLRD